MHAAHRTLRHIHSSLRNPRMSHNPKITPTMRHLRGSSLGTTKASTRFSLMSLRKAATLSVVLTVCVAGPPIEDVYSRNPNESLESDGRANEARVEAAKAAARSMCPPSAKPTHGVFLTFGTVRGRSHDCADVFTLSSRKPWRVPYVCMREEKRRSRWQRHTTMAINSVPTLHIEQTGPKVQPRTSTASSTSTLPFAVSPSRQ